MSHLFLSDTMTLSNLQVFFGFKATFHNVAQACLEHLVFLPQPHECWGNKCGPPCWKASLLSCDLSFPSSFPSFISSSSALLSFNTAVVPRAFLYSHDFNHHSSLFTHISRAVWGLRTSLVVTHISQGVGLRTSLVICLMSNLNCLAMTSHTLLTLKCIQICSAGGTISSQEPIALRLKVACESLPPSPKSASEPYRTTHVTLW